MGEYDAILGDREASVGTYREFVVFNSSYVYPEYRILYERIWPEDSTPVERQRLREEDEIGNAP